MLSKPVQYWWHRLTRKGELKLAMTILVKNEADIIEDNIRFHSKQGVDCFAVMDNGSDDGTREILEKLKAEFHLHIIDQPEQNYQQALWMTQLSEYARKHLDADLVISNDADEFWKSTDGLPLKLHLNATDSVVTVRRHNMALSEDALKPSYHYTDANLVVKNPIMYDSETQIKDNAVSMLLVKISPKTIVNPHGLIRMKGGNHRARHGWRWINKRNESKIKVFHYPIRSYEQFEANIKNRKRLLETTNAKMGDHYRRWVRLYDEGELKNEFSNFILKKEDVAIIEKLGVLQKTNPIKETI